MLVCKQWHDIVTSIWSSLNLGTTTSAATVEWMLERTRWLLDIVVDTDSDRDDSDPSGGGFKAIFAALEATPRWRSFIVESFPARADLPEDRVNRLLQLSSNATMNRFTTFMIKSACETSPSSTVSSAFLAEQLVQRLPQWKSIHQMSYHFLLPLILPSSVL